MHQFDAFDPSILLSNNECRGPSWMISTSPFWRGERLRFSRLHWRNCIRLQTQWRPNVQLIEYFLLCGGSHSFLHSLRIHHLHFRACDKHDLSGLHLSNLHLTGSVRSSSWMISSPSSSFFVWSSFSNASTHAFTSLTSLKSYSLGPLAFLHSISIVTPVHLTKCSRLLVNRMRLKLEQGKML